jgi:hypothetical protein
MSRERTFLEPVELSGNGKVYYVQQIGLGAFRYTINKLGSITD